MPYLFNDAAPEQREKIQAFEDRADDRYKLVRLLSRPRNLATWALLTRMALEVETTQQHFGAGSSRHKIALIVLDRCIAGFKFIVEHGKPESRLIRNFTWHGSLIEDANHAFLIFKKYGDFSDVFPMRHKNHEKAELISDDHVRFYIPNDSERQRQTIAYQQGARPTQGANRFEEAKRKDTPRHIT
jgi:hypothetical protein